MWLVTIRGLVNVVERRLFRLMISQTLSKESSPPLPRSPRGGTLATFHDIVGLLRASELKSVLLWLQ